MKSTWKWVALFLGVFIVAFLGALLLFSGNGYGWMPIIRGCADGVGMWGGYRGQHMLGSFGFFGGWLMMFGMLIIPLVLIGILVLGGVALVKGLIKPQSPMVAVRSCANCGKVVQTDWANCPFCGKPLS